VKTRWERYCVLTVLDGDPMLPDPPDLPPLSPGHAFFLFMLGFLLLVMLILFLLPEGRLKQIAFGRTAQDHSE
jgi:hypothetical protein